MAGVVVVAITWAALILTMDAEPHWGLSPVLGLLPVAVITMLSSLCANLLPNTSQAIWQLDNTGEVVDFLRGLRKKLQQPLRVAGIVVTTALIVGAGVVLRPTPTGLEPGDLVIMSASPSDPADARSMILDQWNRQHPDNHARFEYAPVNSDEQHTRLVQDAQPEGQHTADLYVLDVVWMAEFIDRQYVRALDESTLPKEDQGDFVPKVRHTCEDENGDLWALPLNSDVGLIYYRTDIPGVGEPKSWDAYFGSDAKNAVAAARASDPRVKAASGAQLSTDDEMLAINALEAIWANNGRVVDLNGQPAMTANKDEVEFSRADLAALEQLADASRDPDVVMVDDVKKTSADAAAQDFKAGLTVYMRNWPVARDIIGDDVPFRTVAPPTPSVLGGQNLAIAAHTEKPRAAQALIQFLTSASSEQILSEVGGFVPTRQSALNNSRRPDADQIQVALNAARPRPVTPNYVEFSQVFRQGIARALNDHGRLENGFAKDLADVLNSG